jgi:uncharacterized protein (TIGR03435 family)
MDAIGSKLDAWSRTFTLILARDAVDKTGLEGPFDAMHLEYASDDTGGSPSIYTAVQEQLGLKLEPARGPVDSLVIDHIEKPSGN